MDWTSELLLTFLYSIHQDREQPCFRGRWFPTARPRALDKELHILAFLKRTLHKLQKKEQKNTHHKELAPPKKNHSFPYLSSFPPSFNPHSLSPLDLPPPQLSNPPNKTTPAKHIPPVDIFDKGCPSRQLCLTSA